MDEHYEHSVTVAKADLGGRIVPNRFTLNRSPVLVGGQPFGAGTLVFLGFAGAQPKHGGSGALYVLLKRKR